MTICPLLYLSLVECLPVVLRLGLLLSSSLGSPWMLPTLLFSWLLLINFLSTLSNVHLGYLFDQSLREVLHFFIKESRLGANCSGSVD